MESHYYVTLFKDKLLNSYGDSFEDIFTELMKTRFDNFIQITPQGQIGDRKCDGYRQDEGIFYQVYGPRDNTTPTSAIQNTAINKMADDFEKLYVHVNNGYWEKINEYTFVFNMIADSYPDLEEKRRELQYKYEEEIIKFKIYNKKDLIKIFSECSKNDQRFLSFNIPMSIDTSIIKFDIVYQVVDYLFNNTSISFDSELKFNVRDFNDKIKFNNLNENIKDKLTFASYNIIHLDDYLDSVTEYPNLIDKLAIIYKDLYKQAVKKYPGNTNRQFEFIVMNSMDKNILHEKSQSIYVSQIMIIMSKFFESCDIFEIPPNK